MNIFKNTAKTLCLCLAMFLPLTTHAQPSGEIIFQHGEEPFEIWIGNVREKRTSRRIFNRLLLPMTLAIQKGDRYILTVAERFADDELALAFDAYLLDRQRPRATEKNLTQGKYGDILDADVSKNGDVIFTNSGCPNVLVACGLYLIPQHEREKLTPKAELLLQVDAGSVDWAPNGKKIAYCTKNSIFGFDLLTKTSIKYTHHGCYPVFSPDGRHIAYIHRGDPKKTQIGLFSLSSGRTIKIIELKENDWLHYLTWTADGQYIVYTLIDHDSSYLNFAVSLDRFHTTRILESYPGGVPKLEWTSRGYFVEPANRLTTLWGELKQQDAK